MLTCVAYQNLREKMWTEFEEVTRTNRESYICEIDQMNALIGDRFQPKESDEKDSHAWQSYKEIVKIVMIFITEAMNRRRGLQE